MRLTSTLIVIAVLALFGSAFAAHHLAGEKPAAEGKAVVAYLTQQDYQKWPLWPGKSKLYPGSHPHGAYLTTYVSQGAFKAIEGKVGIIPAGEFIVKENYTSSKELAAITVMYKQAGYNPDGGDWFWLKYKPDGSVEKEGKVGGCIGCHSPVQGNDWLFTGPVK